MIANTPEAIKDLCSALHTAEEAVIDTETTGIDIWGESRICGIGVLVPGKGQWYVPVRHESHDSGMPLFAGVMGDEAVKNISEKSLQVIFIHMQKPKLLIGHNIKFDLGVLSRDGFILGEDQQIADTHNAARLYFSEKHPDMSLENCVRKLLGEDSSKWKAEFSKYLKDRKIEHSYHKAEISVIADYCLKDCVYTWRIYKELTAFIKETGQETVWEQEKAVLKLLHEMERKGLNLDISYIDETIPVIESAAKSILADIEAEAGYEINPWSNPQLTELFESKGIKPKSFTDKGAPQWTDEIMTKLNTKLSDDILNWRRMDKLLNTYFIPYSSMRDGLVHCNFNIAGTVTGRLSCTNPNLQQVSRNEQWFISQAPDFNVQVRKMFVPPKDYSAYYMDYSQMEMLVYADYLSDPELTNMLNAGGTDFHSLTAKMIWKCDESHKDWKQYRIAAKSVSLGLIYGMGINKLAGKIGCDAETAQNYKDEYFKAFPNAPIFFEKVKQAITRRGYVFNKFGRRYYLPEDKSYVAVNYLIQGTSADLIKQAMLRINDCLKGTKSRIALQMHDEFGLYLHKDEEKELLPLVHKAMEKQTLKVFLPASISKANPNWSTKINYCAKCYNEEEDGHKCDLT